MLFKQGNAPCDIKNGNANVERRDAITRAPQSGPPIAGVIVQFNLLLYSLPSAGYIYIYILYITKLCV
jgi:hypothetical protein